MKVNIAKYVVACGACQQMKIEHKKPTSLLLPLEIPKWKWELISMDSVVVLPSKLLWIYYEICLFQSRENN